MPARTGLRRWLGIVPAAALMTVALPVSAALAGPPGLPRTFKVTKVDSADPVNGAAFGWGIFSADLTGDGKQDLLVAQGQLGTAAVPTQVFIYDGATGKHIDTIKPPEDNPLTATGGYDSPELAFVYVETMPDLGSCPHGDGADAGKICDDPVIGDKDGIPEIIVGARALRVNATDGSIPATLADPRIGRGYVIDGKTRAVLKRIDMPAVDRQAVLARSGANSTQAFGRTMASPQGMPPCAGKASENNDTGVGACPKLVKGTGDTTIGTRTITNANLPGAAVGDLLVGPGIPLGARLTVVPPGGATLTFQAPGNPTPNGPAATATATGVALQSSDYRYPQAVRIGDLDGGGEPDIVVTARGFPEIKGPAGSAAAGSECKLTTTPISATSPANCGAGKIWTYRGEDIVGTTPTSILDTAYQSIQNPEAQAGPAGGEYAGNLYRVGDIAGNDGIPDYVIPYRTGDFPLKAPDLSWGLNMGSADLFNGRTGVRAPLGGRDAIVSPEPQQRATFGGGFNAGRAVGDLGATDTPDILLPAPFQNLQYADQGRLWVFNGDGTAGGGGEQSWNFAMLNDPEPYIGGNFGGGLTGVGDVVGGPGAPANEVLVGGFRFDNFTEASQNTVPDVNFMNATRDRNLMTIPHPEGRSGDGFGVGITPMGDINQDGFLDFAVSAYFTDVAISPTCCGGLGRAWIFTSDDSPLPPPPTQAAPIAAGPVTPATADKPLQAGACVNETIGTDRGEMLKGTLAGDRIFGFAGNDTLMGYEGEDCIDAGPGDDSVMGGDARDKLIGAGGADTIKGEDGRDDLFGGYRNDRLFGGYGRDVIAGGAGNDKIDGGADADRLYGEAGKDRIIAGDGRNHIDGGAGNDTIDSYNKEIDRVKCGRGFDRVTADANDRLNGCERVTIGKSKKATKK